jgi:hypothetical protein
MRGEAEATRSSGEDRVHGSFAALADMLWVFA